MAYKVQFIRLFGYVIQTVNPITVPDSAVKSSCYYNSRFDIIIAATFDYILAIFFSAIFDSTFSFLL
jgi:hypothetical protein